ncbi:MAG: STAS-like domain-containing protein [Fimbriimonadaceae bacterium]|nr:STAS-like domain-containing protein [Fimbriimonadaceae bacterium]
MTIDMESVVGSFAENKDLARDLRRQSIEPALAAGETVILNFAGVTGATQSFVHAMMSELIRTYGEDLFDKVLFQKCSAAVQEVVETVAEYMLESL